MYGSERLQHAAADSTLSAPADIPEQQQRAPQAAALLSPDDACTLLLHLSESALRHSCQYAAALTVMDYLR